MKKGEIYFASLDPVVGSEINKTRPVLIISNDINNQHHSLITVVPLTSQIGKVFPFEVFLSGADTGLQKDSKAKCNQIRTISKQRLTSQKSAGALSEELFSHIQRAIKLHLDLD